MPLIPPKNIFLKIYSCNLHVDHETSKITKIALKPPKYPQNHLYNQNTLKMCQISQKFPK